MFQKLFCLKQWMPVYFKYVKFKRLLEVETGFTKNEPLQLGGG